MPFKKAPDEKGTLADQVQENRQKLLRAVQKDPDYAVNFRSSTFGQILLKEIRHPWYTAELVRSFFFNVDFSDKIFVYVDNKDYPYVTNDSILSVQFEGKRKNIPVSLLRLCLPPEVKER